MKRAKLGIVLLAACALLTACQSPPKIIDKETLNKSMPGKPSKVDSNHLPPIADEKEKIAQQTDHQPHTTKQEEKSVSNPSPYQLIVEDLANSQPKVEHTPIPIQSPEKPKTRTAKTVNFDQLLDQAEKVAKLCIAMERMVKRKLPQEEKIRNDTIRELKALKKMFEKFKKQHPILTRSKREQELVSIVPGTINRVEESIEAFKTERRPEEKPTSTLPKYQSQREKTNSTTEEELKPDNFLLKMGKTMNSASNSHDAANRAYQYYRYHALAHINNALSETKSLKDQYEQCIRQFPHMKQQLANKGFTIRTIEKVEQTMIRSKANIQSRIRNRN